MELRKKNQIKLKIHLKNNVNIIIIYNIILVRFSTVTLP